MINTTDPTKPYAYAFSDRAVVMIRDLRCPKCQQELTAESVNADLFGRRLVGREGAAARNCANGGPRPQSWARHFATQP